MPTEIWISLLGGRKEGRKEGWKDGRKEGSHSNRDPHLASGETCMYVMLCNVMLCYVMLCNVMECNVM